jgi:hypothetical protein
MPNQETIDRTFYILDGLKNLGPEYFDLKIRLVHQELQEAKEEKERAALDVTQRLI